jgi:hypothetical protein
MSFSRRVLHMDPYPWPALMHIADATGYPLTHPYVLQQDATPSTSGDLGSCPSRARPPGDSRGTTDNNGQNLTDRAQNTFLLTPRDGPLLCKAVLRHRLVMRSNQGPARICQSHTLPPLRSYQLTLPARGARCKLRTFCGGQTW